MLKKNDLVLLPADRYGPNMVGLVIAEHPHGTLFIRTPSSIGVSINDYVIETYDVDPEYLEKNF